MKLEMVGRLNECFLLAYSVDAGRAAQLIPAGLQLVTCRRNAFLNIVVSRVDRMRPVFVPRALGVTYWHIAYRLQVRARLAQGGSLEGLHFLRSDVDRHLFGSVGNWLTDFRFHGARIRFSEEAGAWQLRVAETHGGHGDVGLHLRGREGDALAPESPFDSLQERDRVLKYAPFGLSVSRSGRILRVAEVTRDESAWEEAPVEVVAAEWAFPRRLGFEDLRLERATRVAPLDYRWSLGRRETLAST